MTDETTLEFVPSSGDKAPSAFHDFITTVSKDPGEMRRAYCMEWAGCVIGATPDQVKILAVWAERFIQGLPELERPAGKKFGSIDGGKAA